MSPANTVANFKDLIPNPDWASLSLFDRKGWRRVKFEEFAKNVNERVEPSNEPEAEYVGLEHIEPQNLHIRKWGKATDVTGSKLRFKKGDVIFGRRRAYQRKLAVAEFDGICSAHAMVVRAKAETILPEFLPFLMMSDRFMNRAVEISVGSLSPTINWKSLRHEEFDLPPFDQQRRIAEILWAIDKTAVEWAEVTERAVRCQDVDARAAVFPLGFGFTRSYMERYEKNGTELLPYNNIFEVVSGNGEPTQCENGEALFLKVNDFNLNEDANEIVKASTRFRVSENPKTRILPKGSVVLPKRGASIFLNKVGVTSLSVALDPNLIGLIPLRGRITSEYLYWMVKLIGIGQIADTTSLPQINHKHFKPLLFPVPSISRQNEITEKLRSLGCLAKGASNSGNILSSFLYNLLITLFH